MVRHADIRDLEQALDMADAKRQAVVPYHPIFHRPATNARSMQAPWFRTMIERSDIITLVHEGQDGINGFIAASPLPGSPLTFSVDDFVVDRPGLWPSVGRALLAAARQEVRQRGAQSWEVNCQPRDESKRRMLVGEGLVVGRINMANHDPLAVTRGHLGSSPVPVRGAELEDLDDASERIMEQSTRYHRLDPTYYRAPEWEAERRRLRGVMEKDGSMCLATGEPGSVRALLLAGAISAIPVYDPGGPVYFIQSLVVSQRSWEIDGRAVLIEAVQRMVERDAAMINTFSLPDDPERTATLSSGGLSVVTEFFCQDVG